MGDSGVVVRDEEQTEEEHELLVATTLRGLLIGGICFPSFKYCKSFAIVVVGGVVVFVAVVGGGVVVVVVVFEFIEIVDGDVMGVVGVFA